MMTDLLADYGELVTENFGVAGVRRASARLPMYLSRN